MPCSAPRPFLAAVLLLAAVAAEAGDAPVCPLKSDDVVVFLGDSITAFAGKGSGFISIVRASLAPALPGVQVFGAGVPGNKVRDLHARFDKDVAARKPTVVVVYIGINDVWHGKGGSTPEQYATGMRDLLKRIKDLGARALVCTPSVIGEKKAGANKNDVQLEQYADIARAAATEAGVPVIDLRKAFLARIAERNAEDAGKGVLTGDGVHLNAAGNRLVAEQVCAAFGIALVEPPAEAPKPAPAPK